MKRNSVGPSSVFEAKKPLGGRGRPVKHAEVFLVARRMGLAQEQQQRGANLTSWEDDQAELVYVSCAG